MRRRGSLLYAFLVIALVLAVVPLFGISDYVVTLITQMFIYGIAAMGLDILVGYTGMVSFAQATFFGVAAYGVAIFTTEMHITNFFAVSVLAILLAVATSAAMGLLALRAKGVGFIIITLALNELVWGLAYQWVNVSGGDNGITGFLRPVIGAFDLNGTHAYYYFSLIVLAACGTLMYLIVRSPFGLALRGIREHPRRMGALGYNVWVYQYIAFIVAAFFGAIAGVLIAYFNEFVGTNTVDLAQSTQILIMSILGGTGTLWGSLLGSGIIVTLSYEISNYTQRWETILGAIYVIVVMFAPDGIMGIGERVWSRMRGGKRAEKEVVEVQGVEGRVSEERGR